MTGEQELMNKETAIINVKIKVIFFMDKDLFFKNN
jgi:hypothetical protein